MKPYFILKFGTELNKEVNVKINNANTELDSTFVQLCMNDLIGCDPFDTDKGSLKKALQAQLVHYSVRKIAV